MKKRILNLSLFGFIMVATANSAYAVQTLVMGTVNPNGTSQNSTTAFTISHPSRGRYIITFSPATFNNAAPACIVMPIGGAQVTAIWQAPNYCDFTLNNGSTDAFFNFIATPITR
jgi:hypothetical protein